MTGDTLPNVEVDPVVTEQVQVRPIDNETHTPEPVVEEPATPAAEPTPEEPVDARAARLEQIAERRREQETEVREQAAETIETPPVVEPVPAEPERKIKLKIRGEEVELTESEVIARAQKNSAADDYLSEARNILKEVKETVKQPEPATPEPKRDRLAEAIEKLQSGGDPVEVRAIMDEELDERAQAAARSVVETDRQGDRSARYDQDVTAGFTTAAADHKDLMADHHFARDVFDGFALAQRELVSVEIDKLDAAGKAAFAQNGIARDTLKTYSSQEINALYKDMALKGYVLPPPTVVIKTIAKNFAERWPTKTEPQPQPPPNRTERKEAHAQPERTAIPKPSPRPAPPKNEEARATSARAELRDSRRKGVEVRR